MTSSASASGKIILSGEYAVLFGKRGIAVPSTQRLTAIWTPVSGNEQTVTWDGATIEWVSYAKKILTMTGAGGGTLEIQNNIPIGKGMGSSSALVIAVCRAILGSDCKDKALQIENELSPGNSGLDFAVIWEEKPIVYRKNSEPEMIELGAGLLKEAELIDTGTPNEVTSELVAWVKSCEANLKEPIATIGECTERILKGESLKDVIRDHHRAQVALGVVPEKTQEVIADIEKKGGAAKVIGAGARTGGGGMVLVLR